MSTSGSRARLVALTKDLSNKWQGTKEQWKDAKGEEFERKYLEELFATVNSSIPVIEQLDLLVTKIRKDCE